MTRATWLCSLLLLSLVWGCGPPPVAGPRQTGAISRAFVGDAEVVVRYRYEPKPGGRIELLVDLTAKGADGGTVDVRVMPDGLELVGGELSWRGALPAGRAVTHQLTLEAGAELTPTVTVVTRHVEREVELSSDTLRFLLTEVELRECLADDEACAGGQPAE